MLDDGGVVLCWLLIRFVYVAGDDDAWNAARA